MKFIKVLKLSLLLSFLVILYYHFKKGNEIKEQDEIIRTLKINYKYLNDNPPDNFYIEFDSFGKNFTCKFVQINKDSAHPIDSDQVYTINNNGEARRHVFQEEQVKALKRNNPEKDLFLIFFFKRYTSFTKKKTAKALLP